MNLREALGASSAATAQTFAIYMPDRDRTGEPIAEISAWVELALKVMSEINGGATCLAPAIGIWRNSSGSTIRETTRVVYSFVRKPKRFENNIDRLATLLHSFGEATNQGEVMVEFSAEEGQKYRRRAYYIDSYPKARDLAHVR